MDILSNLNNAILYIENHLSDEIQIEEAAKIALESTDSFLRLFRTLTNMTVKEYIRKRRLTLAAYDLQYSSNKVIDIAVKYGWNSADAFCKAFYNQHKITPIQARDKCASLNIYPPVSFHIKIKGAEKMNFKIVKSQGMEVFGVTNYFAGDASQRFEKEHIMWSDEYDNTPKRISDGYDGVWYGIWNKGNYTIARAKEDTAFDNLESVQIKSAEYAVFTTETGGYAGDELPKLRSLIFDSWLPDSMYKQVDDYEIEVYHLWTDRAERRAKRYYEIWIPVEEK